MQPLVRSSYHFRFLQGPFVGVCSEIPFVGGKLQFNGFVCKPLNNMNAITLYFIVR